MTAPLSADGSAPADVAEGMFWPTSRRLLGLLRPFRLQMAAAIAATCGFAGLNVAAPKYLGDATDVVVDGVLEGVLNQQRLGGLLAAVALSMSGRRCSTGSKAR